MTLSGNYYHVLLLIQLMTYQQQLNYNNYFTRCILLVGILEGKCLRTSSSMQCPKVLIGNIEFTVNVLIFIGTNDRYVLRIRLFVNA